MGDRWEGQLSDIEDVPAEDWLYQPSQNELTAQTFHQQNGFSITLLRISSSTEDEDRGIDDAYERFAGPDEERRR